VTVRNLDALFAPRSVALIGASGRAGALGAVVLRNLLRGRSDALWPVNPKYAEVAGLRAYHSVAELPAAPELAVICTPAASVPRLIAELGARGTRAAVVLSAGLGQRAAGEALSWQEQMLRAARPHTLRVLGPNCVGLLVPGQKLNASSAHLDALPGELGFVSQSGALCTAVLDWAHAHGVGFSHFVSLGESADIDLADVLDHLGSDPGTRAILLYVEGLRGARKHLSAARAAARNKPVLVLKTGRVQEGARAATSRGEALAGSDAVYDAAIARTGMLRVFEIEELFEAAETLQHVRRPRGERLAILGNGGGPSLLAADALIAQGGTLANLAPATLEQLDAVLPPTGSRANPLDLGEGAPAQRYAAALPPLLDDPGVDAVLVLHAPSALASGADTARAVAHAAAAHPARRTLLAAWLGEHTAAPARSILREAGIPCFQTSHSAVRAFLHGVRYRRNQELLMETPPSLALGQPPDSAAVRAVFARARGEGRTSLDEAEAKEVLNAYGIAVVPTRIAADAQAAVRAAEELGYPVALKLLSPDVSHRSERGAVALDLDDAAALAAAAQAIAKRLAALRPGARFAGYSVQPMARRPGALELIAGLAADPLFGPVLLFGEGGADVEVIRDRAVALPPLNAVLARELVSRTRISRRLASARGHPPADLEAILRVLIQLSQLQIDFPEIEELDVNPLLADAAGALALDARIRIAAAASAPDRLAIRPYPRELEEVLELAGVPPLLARPIRPEDEPAHLAFFQQLTPEDIHFRFFHRVREMPHSQLARFTQIDYDREMAFIATPLDGAQQGETLGVARAVSEPDGERAEFAIIVRSDWKGRGLGHALLEKLIRYCRQRGLRQLVGQILPENRPMLELASSLGFRLAPLPRDHAVEARLSL
jgi:acetyltransferase